MMDCEKIRPLLSEYLDDCLPEVDTLLVKEHLSECADCAKCLDFMQRLMEGLREENVTAPEGMVPSIMEKISGRSKKRGFFARPFTAAAVIILLAFVGWHGLNNGAFFSDKALVNEGAMTAQGGMSADVRTNSSSDTQASGSDTPMSATFEADDSVSDAQITDAPAAAGRTMPSNAAPYDKGDSGGGSGPQEGAYKASIRGFAPPDKSFVTYSSEPAKVTVDIPYALLAEIKADESKRAEIIRGLKVLKEGYYLADENQWQSIQNRANEGDFSITVYSSTLNMKDGILVIFK